MTNNPLCPYCHTRTLIKKTCGHKSCQKEKYKARYQANKEKRKAQYQANKAKALKALSVTKKTCPFCNQGDLKVCLSSQKHLKTCGHIDCRRALQRKSANTRQGTPEAKSKERARRQKPEVKALRLKTDRKRRKRQMVLCPVCKENKKIKESKTCLKCNQFRKSGPKLIKFSIDTLLNKFKVKGSRVFDNNTGHVKPQYLISRGYYGIRAFTQDVKAHRLIWTLENKRHIKPGFVIDHINGVKLDNHPLNLRELSSADNNRFTFLYVQRTCEILSHCEQADFLPQDLAGIVLKHDKLRRLSYDYSKEIYRPQDGLNPAGADLYSKAIRELDDYRHKTYMPALFKIFKENTCENSLLYFAHNWKRIYGYGHGVGGFIKESQKEWDRIKKEALERNSRKDFGAYHRWKAGIPLYIINSIKQNKDYRKLPQYSPQIIARFSKKESVKREIKKLLCSYCNQRYLKGSKTCGHIACQKKKALKEKALKGICIEYKPCPYCNQRPLLLRIGVKTCGNIDCKKENRKYNHKNWSLKNKERRKSYRREYQREYQKKLRLKESNPLAIL